MIQGVPLKINKLIQLSTKNLNYLIPLLDFVAIIPHFLVLPVMLIKAKIAGSVTGHEGKE